METDKVKENTDNRKWNQACKEDTLHLVSKLVKEGIIEKARLESQ